MRAEDDVRKILEIVLRDRSSKVRVFELSRLFIVCYNTKDMSEKAPKKKRKNKNPIDSKRLREMVKFVNIHLQSSYFSTTKYIGLPP